MNSAPDALPDAGLVRFLKILVTALAVTMVVGLIVLIGLFVMRFPDASAPFPAEIALPDGTTVSAITRGPDWLLVVTSDGRALVYSPDGRILRQEIVISGASSGD